MRTIAVLIATVSILCTHRVNAGAGPVTLNDIVNGQELSAKRTCEQGLALLKAHKFEEARKVFDAAIRAHPDLAEAYYDRSIISQAEKKWNAAMADLNQTIRLEPSYFPASWDRALLYETMGNYAAALRDFNAMVQGTYEATNVDGMSMTLNERAWLKAACPVASFRDGAGAVKDAKRACELSKWKRAQYVDTLAVACAESGDFDSAIRYEEQAIDLKKAEEAQPKEKSNALPWGSTQSYQQHLESFKRHQAWHVKPEGETAPRSVGAKSSKG